MHVLQQDSFEVGVEAQRSAAQHSAAHAPVITPSLTALPQNHDWEPAATVTGAAWLQPSTPSNVPWKK